jgi:hypothetical protein
MVLNHIEKYAVTKLDKKTKNRKDLIKQVYFPPINKNGAWSFQDYIGHDGIRYYSYARHALYDALKLCGIKKGDKVLIPGFICREVLSPINAVGATPVFYDVTSKLEIKLLNEFSKVKALIVVNYFGFPAELSEIREYCSINEVFVIEDNSHGFLSKDNNNKPLGTRADIGLFCFRKSMPVINGAALVVNNFKLVTKLNKQLNYDNSGSKYEFIKRTIKKVIPFNNFPLIFFLIKLKQAIRNIIKGDSVSVSTVESESDLPGKPSPSIDLKRYIKVISIDKEIERRRALYAYLTEYIGGEVKVIFDLNSNITPYVFPFRCDNINAIKKKLNKISLDCYKWPELPEEIKLSCPEHYGNVWMVPFLW